MITALFIFCSSIFNQSRSFSQESDNQPKLEIEIIKEIEIPQGYHEGIFISGNDIWVNNGEGGNTWIIDVSTGELKGEIKPIDTFTEGLTIDAFGNYWISDWNAKKLYRAKLESGAFLAENEFSFEPDHPTGVVYAEDNIYLITWTRGMGTVYYITELGTNGLIKRKSRIAGIFEPSQIAWDGRNLWITSWYSARVYKVDRESFEVLCYFVSPVSDTTGIAFQGEYCWLTGTKSNLFEIRILPSS